jgi:hypothetical protein
MSLEHVKRWVPRPTATDPSAGQNFIVYVEVPDEVARAFAVYCNNVLMYRQQRERAKDDHPTTRQQ